MYRLGVLKYKVGNRRGVSENGAFPRLLNTISTVGFYNAFDYLALGTGDTPSDENMPYLVNEVARVSYIGKADTPIEMSPPLRGSLVLTYYYRNNTTSTLVVREWGTSETQTPGGPINVRGLFDPPLSIPPGEIVSFGYAPQVIVFQGTSLRPTVHVQLPDSSTYLSHAIMVKGISRLLRGDSTNLYWIQRFYVPYNPTYTIMEPTTINGPSPGNGGLWYEVPGVVVDLTRYYSGTNWTQLSIVTSPMLWYGDEAEYTIVVKKYTYDANNKTITIPTHRFFASLQAKV